MPQCALVHCLTFSLCGVGSDDTTRLFLTECIRQTYPLLMFLQQCMSYYSKTSTLKTRLVALSTWLYLFCSQTLAPPTME
jgi:hypothetical protein